MLELESSHLRLREVAAENLPALLPIYLSHPRFVARNEGSGGEPGHYDRGMFRRDWQIAQITPGRVMLGIYLRETTEPVGQADYLAENPSDSCPWLGLLIIHAAFQRRGLGAEAFTRLAEHFRDGLSWHVVRLGVLTQNTAGRTFWQRMGFREAARSASRDGKRNIIVLEKRLGERVKYLLLFRSTMLYSIIRTVFDELSVLIHSACFVICPPRYRARWRT